MRRQIRETHSLESSSASVDRLLSSPLGKGNDADDYVESNGEVGVDVINNQVFLEALWSNGPLTATSMAIRLARKIW